MPNTEFTVSDHLLERLAEWNVRRIFTYPGDGINGIMGALRRVNEGDGGERFDVVQVAHEELAGLMATAHAKFTGEVGVCLATSGPGAIHMLNGLYDAKLDHQPVVAIVGQQAFAGVGGSTQQETNLRSILQDVASSFLETLSTPEQLRHLIDRAFRAAIGGRTVAAIIVPHDVQQKPAVREPEREHGRQHSAPGFVPPRLLPRDEELRRAAEVLNAGRKVAIIAGAGALHATDEIIAVAERLGAGVAKALLGKAAVPDDLPFVTGSVGWLGTAASNRMMRECDTLFLVGTNFPYTEFLPDEGQARGVQIDTEPRNLSLRYPMEVALAGDSAETLAALLPLLADTRAASWRGDIERWTREAREASERHAHAPADPVNPLRVIWELDQRLPDDVILTADSGTSAYWMGRDIHLRRGMKASVSGSLATMGCGVPYALAAKLAHPGRAVIALVGDGAMQMNGISALIDVTKQWKLSGARGAAWADPRLIVLVLNNRDLSYVTWEQRVMEGDPRYAATQTIPDFPYADYARMIGLDGVRVERPEDVAPAWERALASDKPFVIDALVDRNVPTLPPQLEAEQEDKLAKALAGGDADAEAVMNQLQLQEVTQR
ncbi:MAG TPA: thiamine pyrophosphate-requiring protein [Gemmatimonadaceae bacterium]|nr:thiamine pyrophosphate-requiring protein [Gemmatimonadaceae bacterium]